MPPRMVMARCLVHQQIVRIDLGNFKLMLTSQDAVDGAYEFVCPLGGHDPIRRQANAKAVALIRSCHITPEISTTDPLGPFPIRTNDEEEV